MLSLGALVEEERRRSGAWNAAEHRTRRDDQIAVAPVRDSREGGEPRPQDLVPQVARDHEEIPGTGSSG